MRRALQLAARGRGRTSPNPMVGATIVASDGTIVGDGWHQRAGTPHAEIHAIASAGGRARGATLWCTLEPCCHQGRTGPCTDAIVAAGISRVVAAIEDPNPQVAGQGLARLRASGIEVLCDVEGEASARLNAAFFMMMRQARPWVIAKAGVSADGRVAAGAGVRTSITSTASLRRAQRLRAEVDAIAVGVETVLVDDPLLTVREVFRPRPLTRAILDRRLRTPSSARLLSTLGSGPVVVLTTAEALETRAGAARRLADAGATLVATDGSVASALRALAERSVQSVLVEGGPRIHAAFADAGMIDEVQVFVAQDVFLPDGLPFAPMSGLTLALLDHLQVEPIGDDVLVRGYVHRPH
jgi:diaminohydroxyphosphoribosylaminopyrimidine deaminase/5-amino-6-(5-phosphoribosylamino)uracil reductase